MAISVFGPAASGEKTVAAAGSAEALDTSTPFKIYRAITITAKVLNTGQIFVGGSDVSSSVNDGLDAGETVEFATYAHEFRLADIFIDVATNGEGVDWYASS